MGTRGEEKEEEWLTAWLEHWKRGRGSVLVEKRKSTPLWETLNGKQLAFTHTHTHTCEHNVGDLGWKLFIVAGYGRSWILRWSQSWGANGMGKYRKCGLRVCVMRAGAQAFTTVKNDSKLFHCVCVWESHARWPRSHITIDLSALVTIETRNSLNSSPSPLDHCNTCLKGWVAAPFPALWINPYPKCPH